MDTTLTVRTSTIPLMCCCLSLTALWYDSYWFSTATPGFLIKLLHNQEFYVPELENLSAWQGLGGQL